MIPDDSGTPDADGRSPGQVVGSYVEAMHHWELRAMEAEQRDGNVGQEVLADLRAIREAHLTTRALATNASVSFGSEPAFEPAGLTIQKVEERDRTHARVTTGECPFGTAQHGLGAQEYEYGLVRVDGCWRLNSRTTKGADGHIARDLL